MSLNNVNEWRMSFFFFWFSIVDVVVVVAVHSHALTVLTAKIGVVNTESRKKGLLLPFAFILLCGKKKKNLEIVFALNESDVMLIPT